MNTTQNPTIVMTLCRLLCRLIGWLLLSSVGTLLVAMIIVALLGSERGLYYLQWLLQQDSAFILQLSSPQSHSIMQQGLAWLPQPRYHTNIAWIQALPAHMRLSIAQCWLALLPFINAFLLGCRLVLVRLVILAHWSPLIVLLGTAGCIDGSVQRRIRRYIVARESATRYRHYSQFMAFSLIMAMVLVMALPTRIQLTQWIFTGFIVSFAVAMQLTCKQFKKYS